jgi:hypothetical protein
VVSLLNAGASQRHLAAHVKNLSGREIASGIEQEANGLRDILRLTIRRTGMATTTASILGLPGGSTLSNNRVRIRHWQPTRSYSKHLALTADRTDRLFSAAFAID